MWTFTTLCFTCPEPYLLCSIKTNVSILWLSPQWITVGCYVSHCGETHGWLLMTLETYLWSEYMDYSTGMSSIFHWVTARGWKYANVTLSSVYFLWTHPHTHTLKHIQIRVEKLLLINQHCSFATSIKSSCVNEEVILVSLRHLLDTLCAFSKQKSSVLSVIVSALQMPLSWLVFLKDQPLSVCEWLN